MNAIPVKTRVQKHFERMKDQGMKRVQVWIPAQLEERLRIIVDALKEGKHIVIEESSREGVSPPTQD